MTAAEKAPLFATLERCAREAAPANAEALAGILCLEDSDRDALLQLTMRVRAARSGADVNLEGIVSAKTGGCSEDCAFCSQAGRFHADVAVRPLMDPSEAVAAARKAQRDGASEFCLVIAVRGPNERVLARVIDCVRAVHAETPLKIAVSLGIMGRDQVRRLKAAGVSKVNHNLEAGRDFFPRICTTHTYEERLATCRAVRDEGLELCSGGIFGMGESNGDRVDLACALQALEPAEVPVNFLDPRPKTPLQDAPPLSLDEALRCVALMRFALPHALIRLSGGRERTLGERQLLGLAAGADGLIVGDYLTTRGQDAGRDHRLVADFASAYRSWGA